MLGLMNSCAAISLLVAHAGLITAGYALTDRLSLPRETWSLLTTFPGVLTATAGLVALVGVVIFGDDRTIRLSYATSIDVIKKGLDRFQDFCRTL